MAEPGLNLYAFVGGLLARQDEDVLREGVRVPAQAVMEPEVTALIGAILLEQDGEWAVDERRCSSAESRKRLPAPALAAVEQDLLMAFA